MKFLFPILALALVGACTTTSEVPDAGADAGEVSDAGEATSDAGEATSDAGEATSDAGANDAGSEVPDAGSSDAGASDAG